MSPSSLESGVLAAVIARNPQILDVTVDQMQNLQDVSTNQMQGHSNGRVFTNITQLARSLPSQIASASLEYWNNLDIDDVFIQAGKTALKFAMCLPEGFLLYGAITCRNDHSGWLFPCGTGIYSDEIGSDIYAALSVAYPLIVAVGLHYKSRTGH